MKKYQQPKELRSSPKEKTQAATDKESPSFFEKVFELARLVPKGRVTTYGAIAEAAGIRLSARMVGWAMHAAGNVYPPVPAHRVVNRNGMLTGKHHFATPTLMEELLAQEGVVVKDDKIQGFKSLLWTPDQPAAPSRAVKPPPKPAKKAAGTAKKAATGKRTPPKAGKKAAVKPPKKSR